MEQEQALKRIDEMSDQLKKEIKNTGLISEYTIERMSEALRSIKVN